MLPYWTESDERSSARWKLAGVFALTLGTTGVRCELPNGRVCGWWGTHRRACMLWLLRRACARSAWRLTPGSLRSRLTSCHCSVVFNFLNRDFFNGESKLSLIPSQQRLRTLTASPHLHALRRQCRSLAADPPVCPERSRLHAPTMPCLLPFLLPALSAKDQEEFSAILVKFIAAICAGIPVFVLRCVWVFCAVASCAALPRPQCCVHVPALPAGLAGLCRRRSSHCAAAPFLSLQGLLPVQAGEGGGGSCWLLGERLELLRGARRVACPGCTHAAILRAPLTSTSHPQNTQALEWRQWMTERFTADYFYDRTFYQVQVRVCVCERHACSVCAVHAWLPLGGCAVASGGRSLLRAASLG